MATSDIRGADIVMRTLERAGHHTIFTLSGNHIMSLFDAAIDTRQRLVHTRHEAAVVHMVDAWGRLFAALMLPPENMVRGAYHLGSAPTSDPGRLVKSASLR